MIVTWTNPDFRSCFLFGSIGIRLGRQFFVIGNLIFCDCGTFTNGAVGLFVPGSNEINPGGAPTILGLICCTTVLPDVNAGLFNCVIVKAEFDFVNLWPRDCDVTVKLGVLIGIRFTMEVVTLSLWLVVVEELWPIINNLKIKIHLALIKELFVTICDKIKIIIILDSILVIWSWCNEFITKSVDFSRSKGINSSSFN